MVRYETVSRVIIVKVLYKSKGRTKEIENIYRKEPKREGEGRKSLHETGSRG